MGIHSAVDAVIGYYFQGAYALVRLLDQDEEDAAISIETLDDVVLEGATPTLHQLKHSVHDKVLSEKDDGFWKTLRIWIEHIDEPSFRFQFVTTASIKEDSALAELAADATCYARVVAALDAEAERVQQLRADASAKGEKPGYDDRWPGCKAYLALQPSKRLHLMRRVRIMPMTFNAAFIDVEVRKRLATVPHGVRPKVAERVIEWWDRQAALSLLKKRPRTIHRAELLAQIHDILTSHQDANLPDDFSHIEPPNGTQPKTNIKRQIDLVDGGTRRIWRSTVEHWRARSQRNRWLSEGLPVIDALMRFDDQLIYEWHDKHEELRERVAKGREDPITGGCELLDWSHRVAPTELPPFRTGWTQPHLTRGTYQELANRLHVGWHPDYKTLLTPVPDENGDDN